MTILVRGFRDIHSDDTNPTGTQFWYCAPDSWKELVREGRREGRDGSWSVNAANDSLCLSAPAKKDFWRKTYYDPVLVKDDGPFLYSKLSIDTQYTVEVSFVLTAARQFDQAGLVLRAGPEHWIKTGIEVVDGKPRASCVVCNIYSDWSTQPWSDYTTAADTGLVIVPARIRIHCRGDVSNSFVVEAFADGKWEFMRIAHLSKAMQCRDDPLANHAAVTSAWQGLSPPAGEIWAGVFGCCPEDQAGGSVTFTKFAITEGSDFEHNADGNHKN
jgi:regulation of enolase protein 1 (concanavalin A-like superfamily)